MKNKTIAALLILIFSALSIPSSQAADIPLLTWERGKEQNLVLGGKTLYNNWKITLDSPSGQSLTFSKSAANSAGFIVYSLQIPKNFPLGVYTVATQGKNSPKTTVAGVNVVELVAYNVIQMPSELLLLAVVASFLTTTFSTIRRRRYSPLSYAKSLDLTLNPYDSRFASYPSILRSIYRMRIQAVDNLKKSLFKFSLLRDGELLHKISPVTWALLPLASLFAGFVAAMQSRNAGQVVQIPIAIFAAIAVLGVIDSYSGFVATFGFALLQILGGNVTTVKDVFAVMAIAIAWCAPGLISTTYFAATSRDFNFSGSKNRVGLLIVPAALIGAVLTLVSQMITSSLTAHVGSFFNQKFLVPGLVFLAVIAKHFLEVAIDQAHLDQDLPDGYRQVSLEIARVISPQATLLIAISTFGITYIWTKSLAVGFLCAVLYTLPFLFLLVRFTSTSIKAVDRFPHNIFLESALISVVLLIAFLVISKTPFEVDIKSKILLVFGAIPLILHGFFNAVSDSHMAESEALN